MRDLGENELQPPLPPASRLPRSSPATWHPRWSGLGLTAPRWVVGAPPPSSSPSTSWPSCKPCRTRVGHDQSLHLPACSALSKPCGCCPTPELPAARVWIWEPASWCCMLIIGLWAASAARARPMPPPISTASSQRQARPAPCNITHPSCRPVSCPGLRSALLPSLCCHPHGCHPAADGRAVLLAAARRSRRSRGGSNSS